MLVGDSSPASGGLRTRHASTPPPFRHRIPYGMGKRGSGQGGLRGIPWRFAALSLHVAPPPGSIGRED